MRTRGVSFIEVVIAVCVLLVGLIPAFHVFYRSNFGTVMMRDDITAHLYAAELIDHLHYAGYAGVPIQTDQDVPALPGGDPIDSRFRRRLTVKERLPEGGCADWPFRYKIIQVIVTWETSGNRRSFPLTSLLFEGRE